MPKTTITAWLVKEHEQVMRDIILPEFKKEYPDIDVLLTTTSWEFLWDKVVRYHKRKQGPDVFQIGNTVNGVLAKMGAIRDITKMVNRIGGLNLFTQAVVPLCFYPGTSNIHSVPWYLDMRILCYRDNILNALSINENELLTINGLIKVCGKVHNFKVNNKAVAAFGIFGQKDAMLLHNLAPWIWDFGGDFLSPDTKEIRFNSGRSLQGIKAYFDFINMYCYHETVLQSSAELIENFMIKGSYCFGNFAPTVYNKYLDPASPLRNQLGQYIDIAAMPGGPNGRYTFLGGSNLAISSFSQHPEEAWVFIVFLLQQRIQELFCQLTHQPPSLNKCYTLGFLRDKSIDKALRESLHYGRCFPNLANWALIEDVLVETIHEVLAAIKAGSYSEKMLVDKFNDAAAKAGELLKN
ncbi:MAG: extracellular solute-binding protein [bacterium]|nr:extracellular solute-binding protein [bacterium]